MRVRLNDRLVELEPRRITDVAELRRRMAQGALLYWTMVRPAHAILFDPERQTVCQLAFFKPLWGLERSKDIRHDRYDGLYQVFTSTTPALGSTRAQPAAAAERSDPLFAQAAPAGLDSLRFEPSI